MARLPAQQTRTELLPTAADLAVDSSRGVKSCRSV